MFDKGLFTVLIQRAPDSSLVHPGKRIVACGEPVPARYARHLILGTPYRTRTPVGPQGGVPWLPLRGRRPAPNLDGVVMKTTRTVHARRVGRRALDSELLLPVSALERADGKQW